MCSFLLWLILAIPAPRAAVQDMTLELRLGIQDGLQGITCTGHGLLLGKELPLEFQEPGPQLRVAVLRSQPAAYARLHLECQDDTVAFSGVVMLDDVRKNRVDLYLSRGDDGALSLVRAAPGTGAGTRKWSFYAWKAAAVLWGCLLLAAAGRLRKK